MIDRAKTTTDRIRVISKRCEAIRSCLKNGTFRVRNCASRTLTSTEMTSQNRTKSENPVTIGPRHWLFTSPIALGLYLSTASRVACCQ